MEKIAFTNVFVTFPTPGNMIPVLKQVKAMGYDGAEFAGYDGLSARNRKPRWIRSAWLPREAMSVMIS